MLVSAEWLKDNLTDQNLVILDSRPKTMFLYGHLPQAQSLTIEQVIKSDQFGSHLVGDEKKISSLFGSLGIDETKTVLVVGDSMDPSSARIAWTLLYLGHKNTHLLDANISELQTKGFEFTRKIFSPQTLSFNPNVTSEIRTESENLLENLDKLVVIDARTPQEFMMGHLPNSKLIPFTDGISNAGKLFQDKEFLENIFSQNSVSKDSEIVCYCMHGHRASSLFFQLLFAGYDKVRLYDGSFVEWHGRGFPLE